MAIAYDEMHDPLGRVRAHYGAFDNWLNRTPETEIAHKRREAEISFHRVGITFSVYGEESGNERLIPFDLVPRIVPAVEWRMLEAGLRQRVHALNLFLGDVYGEQRILKEGRVPRDLVLDNSEYRQEMRGFEVPGGVYSHISGIDLVRAGDGEYYVLEDNLRVPSGVSYMLENRRMMARLLPDLFARQQIAPVERYPDMLLDTLREAAPAGVDYPVVAVLTPGAGNSAYFEHAFLAQQMGVELVEGAGPVRRDDFVYMRTTRGPQRVHVIYRRINDDFLDPRVFRADSMLGVPGLLEAYRAGNVTLANAPGTGVADDKSVYPYVPEMIRFYLARSRSCTTCRPILRDPRGPQVHAGAPARTGGEGSPRRRRLRDAGRAGIHQGRDRGVPPAHPRRPRQLHRPAHAVVVDLPHLRRERHGAAPHRPASLRADGGRSTCRWCRAG
jgi:uncharacterized circularly permuted ATP-grasp superfamily protein